MNHKPKIPIILFSICMTTLLLQIPVLNATDREPDADTSITSVEERRILVSLKEERTKLLEFESQLNQRELALKTLETEVDKSLNELKSLREEIQQLLARKNEEENKKIQELSQMYEKMDPAKAAALISSLDEKLAIDILAGMKKKSAAKLLNYIDGAKAVKLSSSFSKLGQD